MAGRFDRNRTVRGWPGRGAAGSTPRTVRPGAPAWSRGGRSRTPLAAAVTFHRPVATGTITFPFESRIRKGPEAETTASLAPTAGWAPGLAAGVGTPARGPGGVPRDDSPSSTATRTRAGSLAAGTLVGWVPP